MYNLLKIIYITSKIIPIIIDILNRINKFI